MSQNCDPVQSLSISSPDMLSELPQVLNVSYKNKAGTWAVLAVLANWRFRVSQQQNTFEKERLYRYCKSQTMANDGETDAIRLKQGLLVNIPQSTQTRWQILYTRTYPAFLAKKARRSGTIEKSLIFVFYTLNRSRANIYTCHSDTELFEFRGVHCLQTTATWYSPLLFHKMDRTGEFKALLKEKERLISESNRPKPSKQSAGGNADHANEVLGKGYVAEAYNIVG